MRYRIKGHHGFEASIHNRDVTDKISSIGPSLYWGLQPCLSDLKAAAVLAAEDHWVNHSGWESASEKTFIICDDDGKVLGECDIEVRSVPEFVGRKPRLGAS